VRSCESLGYTEPTPIQEQGIPVVLSGQDLIGCAETGTGKTAAFLLPAIQKMTEKARPRRPRSCARADARTGDADSKELSELNCVKANRGVTVIGGANIRTQIADLRRGAAIVIATPGRLLDLTERGAVNLSTVEVLVLDEADRMLDMGFLPAIRRILSMLPVRRQTLLFSATMSSEIEKLARTTMKEPKLIEVSPRGQPRLWLSRPLTRYLRSRRRHCYSTCSNAKSLSECWFLPAHVAVQSACPTFFRLAIIVLIGFTLIGRNHSERRRYADFATVAPACWWQPISPLAAWTLTLFRT
jgi:hypothetical protein